MVSRSSSRGPHSKAGRKRPLRRTRQIGVCNPAQAALSPELQHEALTSRITQECRDAFVAALRPPLAEALYKVVRESLDKCEQLFGELELDPPLACKRGCISCCYNQVVLSEPEALYLGFHLLETQTPQQLRELHARAGELVTALEGKTMQEIGMERHLHACLFLQDGTCSVYPARPLVCRGWNSVNADMCRYSNQTGDALAPIENHALPRLLAESIRTGLLCGANDLGLEAGYMLTVRAVFLLLEAGQGDLGRGLLEFLDSWLRGGAFFSSWRGAGV